MNFSFQHSEVQPTGFDLVYMLADADFAVVDADSETAIDTVRAAGRIERAVFVGSEAPANAAIHLRRPIAPARILKALRQLALEHTAPVLSEADVIAPPSVRSALESWQGRPPASPVEIVAAHEDVPTLADMTDIDIGAAESTSTKTAVTPHDAKAAKRGAVRRAWLARSKRHRLATNGNVSRDVLVLDPETTENASLRELLKLFGFEVTAVRNVADARKAMGDRFFSVYFLDITLDVGDGVGLLQSIHDQQPDGNAKPEVLMVVAQLQPADRVRAALAGIGTPLLKPVSRGELARALESRGIALPADARRT